jgi:error-prone DNA polymerase
MIESFVELHARSAFSFLRGASLPEHLAEVAAQLEFPAMALCDRDGVYGAPRFFAAAKAHGVRPIIGSEVTMQDRTVLPLLVETRTGYQNLCRLITRSQLRSPKGQSAVRWDELPEFAEGLVALTGDNEGPLQSANSNPSVVLETLIRTFGRNNIFVEIQRHHLRGEDRINTALAQLAAAHGLPLLATNGVLYAQPAGRQSLDVFTCIRYHTHLDAAGRLLAQNNERHLKSARAMRELFADLPEAIDNTTRLAERLQFSLENLGYEFPRYPVPDAESPDSFLRKQTFAGARRRYGELTPRVKAQLEHELALIAKLGFAGYFLIVWDIINFCRDSDIMVQGRGSAANSAVCYSLGITAVDPVGSDLLFERFLSEGRKGWPDIDLDLPSGDRREQAIQEVYRRYGRLGAAMTANVITYRGRSAAREIGKALNFSNDVLNRFSQLFADGGFPHTLDVQSQLQQSGVAATHPRARPFISLYQSIYGLPRHLGQHSGGMIICQGQLDSIVPLENASMPGRTVAQWDKEDCEDLGIVKVDLLGLGMMSVLQDAIQLTAERGHPVDLAQIPKDDPATFKMMQEADTIGVFQIESRAQMATLPRMQPKTFYDVVIEVAIIRPGPIQGDMVHPYLARRAGREPIDYIDPRLEPVLARTLGVPLFQEQMLKIAMVMADFSGNEAEELRRALSFHRSEERMQKISIKLRERMQAKGIQPQAIERIIQSISSFALYGFPESHAISFAILAYGSGWLKTHRAPEFYASLLNNQPMGFYSPATIVKDARRHGLTIRPVCALRSDWRCTIEADNSVRLGFCVVRGLRKEHAERVLAARARLPFASLEDFQSRALLNKDEFRTLAEIGALNCFAAHRRDALWQVEKPPQPEELFAEKNVAALADKNTASEPLFLDSLFDFARRQKLLSANASTDTSVIHDAPATADHSSFAIRHSSFSPLLPMGPMERLRADFNGMDLTTGPHPMALIRSQLENVWRAVDLPKGRHGQYIRIAGNVICRQRPGTAKGFVFISLEDETGVSNAIVNPKLFEEQRLVITQEPFLIIEGRLQNVDKVVTVKSRRILPLRYNDLVGSVSHDFH